MPYIDGFVTPVPNDKKEEYRKHAAEAWAMFKEAGITRHVECWGDDVPDGKTTDFKHAVKAGPNETVVFSWFEYPSKEVRDQIWAKLRDDPRMQAMGKNMPFDGKRMIYGGFATLFDEKA